MTEPVVFISRFRVKDGKAEEFKRFFLEGAKALETEKPGTLAFLCYLSGDSAHAAIIHIFPDAESMDLHVEGAEERAKAAYEFIEPAGVELHGNPSEAVLGIFRGMADAGVPLLLQPNFLGGFLRS